MTDMDALAIVLDLAHQNIIDIDEDRMEHARQMEAYDIVYMKGLSLLHGGDDVR